VKVLIYVVLSVIALIFSLILTPIVKWIAIKIGAVDKPDERKVHTGIMPRMGGLAIYLSLLVTYIIGILFLNIPENNMVTGLFVGGTIIIFVGILDDRFQISPWMKLLGQLIATSSLLFFDLTLKTIHLPFVNGEVSLGLLSIPITFLWVIGITNAMNLIDGLDGLAAGVCSIAALSFFAVSLMLGNTVVAIISIILFGSLLGFLKYNFHPAKIFMGDTGSLFLGFILATVSLLELKKIGVISFLFPIFILGLPISDTLFAIIRRKLNNMPISKPDKKHLHHCLIDLGFSHKKTVLVMYAVSIIFSLLAVLTAVMPLWFSGIILVVYIVFSQWLAEFIGMFKKEHRPIMKLFSHLNKK
jgi:UDP-GlcNAc:undecaprenyl-phosphate GlcNAc-1-phosphate transferase